MPDIGNPRTPPTRDHDRTPTANAPAWAQVRLTLPDTAMTKGERVGGEVTVTNTSSSTQTFTSPSGDGAQNGLFLDGTDRGGEYDPFAYTQSHVDITLKPGESFRRPVTFDGLGHPRADGGRLPLPTGRYGAFGFIKAVDDRGVPVLWGSSVVVVEVDNRG